MAHSKKILYIHERAERGGAEESLYMLARFLDRTRFVPSFVLPREGDLSSRLREAGIPVSIVPLPRIRDLKGVVAAANRIAEIARAEGSALVHTNSIRSHLYGAYAARRVHRPLVWHERTLLAGEQMDVDRLLSWIPDAIICNSAAIAERFGRRGRLPTRVHVIYNGVDAARFNPSARGDGVREVLGIAADELVIGIASRFDVNKGHELFLGAARSLVDDRRVQRRIRFFVVGGSVFAEDREREADVRGIVDRLGLGDRVVFAGMRDDMPAVYAAMDIVALTSTYEGCSRVVLEAMACGRPVVATRTGGTPELVSAGVEGLLVAPNDERGLTAALAELAQDDTRRAAMGAAGRRRIESTFTIERHVAQTERVYACLTGGA